MKVLGIVGSPRRERGLCHRLVAAVLQGAQEAGAQTETLYLADASPHYCLHCGHGCFEQGDCPSDEEATARSRQVEAADALVIAAPVYVWQVNGLTAAFLDKVRLSTGAWVSEEQHGKAALGIAVAGGTGTGVFPALRALYGWFCLWKYRPLPPLPVTRFNLPATLAEGAVRGQELARTAPRPYGSVWEDMLTYDDLPYLGYSRADEFRWLAEQVALGLLARGGAEPTVNTVRRLLAEGAECAAQGDRAGAVSRYVDAYRTGARAW